LKAEECWQILQLLSASQFVCCCDIYFLYAISCRALHVRTREGSTLWQLLFWHSNHTQGRRIRKRGKEYPRTELQHAD